ncbi:MAG TPA: phosphopantetheine-binding protein [Candidatus Didemnitutus sp.]|nr:phosphopantetheine-binding protein [Candidatus Didemnitutus sp.]
MVEELIAEEPLRTRLKYFVVERLHLRDLQAERIADNEPLLGGRIGLDSLDALELFMGIEEEFGITIAGGDEPKAALTSIASLAHFIRGQLTSATHAG